MERTMHGVTSTSTAAAHREIQETRLTCDQIRAETMIIFLNNNTLRFREGLSWMEIDRLARLEERVNFINTLLDKITTVFNDKTQPMTLISLGAGGLLTEFYIHQQLILAGYKQLKWRVIDMAYVEHNENFRGYMDTFSQSVAPVNHFANEQAYFASGIAADDKYAGARVLLSIAPPTILETCPEDNGLLMYGIKVDNIQEANAIYFCLGDSDHPADLSRVTDSLTLGNPVSSDAAIKITLDARNGFKIDYAPETMGESMARQITPALNKQRDETERNHEAFGLRHIDAICDKYLQFMNYRETPAIKLHVNEYDVSKENLNHYFADNINTLEASFANNTATFSR